MNKIIVEFERYEKKGNLRLE